ncbi:hypothetical protein AZF37_00170 [endosymbiont 'TC1' of Trimyema compressum]|uniref:WecB/TagA/CpsF family glycosyltransferase n=1 Tax=endosymbiont 'TC1' of Trimyema compressum TaxID=243899 RepID=UPI0007F16D3C|nr:WecB/TagA/CpsF family glycosyltransferase [endosymbiont 'TC1' of Trimyema compressum]AMP19798.1 hypothetical protein AZF37_00170 [endosymbiont 'TC1' of Trimyema compressum]
MERINILGAFIHSITMDEALLKIKEYVKKRESVQIITINPEMVYESTNNCRFQKIINSCKLVVPDGYGIVWAAEKFGYHLKERVPGIELMDKILLFANETEYKVFFYGGHQKAIEKAVDNIKNKYPNLNICGYANGFLNEDERDSLINRLETIEPDFLFVGTGTPKQELFIHKFLPNLKSCIAMGVGGSFDVYSGMVKRAPKIWQTLHLEWLYRGITDPERRKRLLVIPKYMKAVRKQKKNNKELK